MKMLASSSSTTLLLLCSLPLLIDSFFLPLPSSPTSPSTTMHMSTRRRPLPLLTTPPKIRVIPASTHTPTTLYNTPDEGSSAAMDNEESSQEDDEEAQTTLPSSSSSSSSSSSTTTTTTATAALPSQDELFSFLSLLKRRLWTKADYLHSHAISGTAFMVIGAIYVLYFLSDELFNSATLALAENGTIGWVPLAVMWTGVINCISCLPMSKFSKGEGKGYDTKGAGFKGLGIGMTMLGIWTAYFFSGHYPRAVAPLDPILALGFLAVIIHGIVNSEVALSKELAEKAPMMTEDGVWKGTTTATGGVDVGASPPTEKETRMEIVLNHRVASYPNLLHLPVLYNIIVGGQEWMYKVIEKFPLEPTLLFHASFGIAVANSIVFLGATLKDRKLMTLRQWLLLQVVVLTPFVTTVVDIGTLGGKVSINPWECYAGLMS